MGKNERYLRGSTQRCPKCGSTAVAHDPKMQVEGYGPGLASCRNCKAIWEPFDPAEVWDKDDPVCSFKEPCNNCAFRPGSNEMQDVEEWKKLIASLKAGASFYCHKGVPIEPGAEHGFAYPTKDDGTPNTRRLRVCRGYLNAIVRLRIKRATEKEAGQ